VALPAFAAARRVDAQLLLTAGRAAISRYLLAVANPQQRRAAGEWNRRTDARQLHRPCSAVPKPIGEQTCHVSRISRETHAFSMSLTLTPHSGNVTHFPAYRKTIFLMSQVFSFCGEK